MITLAILSILGAFLLGTLIMRRRRRAALLAEKRSAIPLFVVGASDASSIPAPPARARPVTPPRAPAATPPRADAHTEEIDPLLRYAPPTVRRARTSDPAPHPAIPGVDTMLGDAVEGHGLRFYRPSDGTLQFLPGRLEIVEGRDDGHEIRFVRTWGPDGNQVTFGRSEGPSYKHVQLHQATVSRLHARLAFLEGRWFLENLSQTNPVVLNGRPVVVEGGTPLDDGDRIEMGEVAFVFRER